MAKSGNKECSIISGKVTKKISIHQGAAGFTTTSNIQAFGTEELVAKAVEVSSGRTLSHLGVEYFVNVNGKKVSLYPEDSREAKSLIQFISAACF